jgi:hypothetical protein
LGGKFKSPPALGAGGLLSILTMACLDLSRAELRRHARHVMMVVMTMMGTNLHLYPQGKWEYGGMSNGWLAR